MLRRAYLYWLNVGAILLANLSPCYALAQATETLRGGAGNPVVIVDETVRREAVRNIPKYQKYVEGLYTRRVFQTRNASEVYQVEVWGLLAAPARQTETASLPGAAVLLLRSGRAVIVTEKEKQTLPLGAPFVLQENESFSVINIDQERPASFSAVIISGVQ